MAVDQGRSGAGQLIQLLAWAWVVLGFGLAQAQPVSLDSPPLALARAALGDRPGTAVAAVWRDGKLQIAGLRDGAVLPEADLLGDQAPLFEIGSISKVFTGLLLAQAEEKGELSLDDTLGQLLPKQVTFSSPQAAAITLRQLVTHTSCLPRLPANFNATAVRGDPYRHYDLSRLWTALAEMKLAQAPPCDALYSNLGFGVLGSVLSERQGKPWEQLVREQITTPLGLVDTRQTLGDQSARLVQGYVGTQATPPWEFQAFAGAGALRSTAQDLVRFGRALAAGRQGPLGAAAERLVMPLARMDGDIGHAIWIRGPAERRTWLHGGATGGYRTLLVVTPDNGRVTVVLASNAQASLDGLQRQLLTQRYPVTAGTAGAAPEPLTDYAGVYPVGVGSGVGPRPSWTFVAQDGQLWARITGQVFSALLPAGRDSFTLVDRVRFDFVRDGDKVLHLRITGSGTTEDARRSADAPPAQARLPSSQLQPLLGRYQADGMSFVVQAVDGQLLVRLNQQPRLPVYPVPGQADRWAYDVVRAELQFERFGNGKVSSLVLHQNGQRRAEKVE